MAMAMGVASLAVTAPKSQLVSPRAAAPNRGGEKATFLDWFRSAIDKESLSETDAVLAKGSDNGKNGSAKKGGGTPNTKKGAPPPSIPPLKIPGFGFFGKK